jgi:deazaflavin-dependent oxidoreductase (nitroreductase family)
MSDRRLRGDDVLKEGSLMPDTIKQPMSRRLQARAFRVVNVPMRLILGLPVRTPLGRNLMLAYVIGRKSGRTYRQPVSYVRDGDALLTPGGGRWKLNLVSGTPVRIRLRGKDISATPELVSDVDEVSRLLRTMAAGNPAAARFVGIPRAADGSFDRDGVARAVQYGFRIVRWHPAASVAATASPASSPAVGS